MWNKYHITILRAGYYNACIEPEYCTKTSLLKGLPTHEANKAYHELVRWNYLILHPGCKIEETVSLNPQHIEEIRQLLNPRTGLFEFEYQPSTSTKLTSEEENWSKSGFRLQPSNQTTTVALSSPVMEHGEDYNDE